MTRAQAQEEVVWQQAQVRDARTFAPPYHRHRGSLLHIRDSDGAPADTEIYDYLTQEWIPIWNQDPTS